jgi:hypothetical protein
VYGRKFPGKNILVLSSDTNDEDITRIMHDVDSVLRDIDLLLFTSKLNIGIDITIPYNDVFVDTSGKGCSPRDLIQMVGRFRRVTNTNVWCLLKTIEPVYLPYEHMLAECRDNARRRNSFMRSMNELFLVDPQFVNGYLTLAPNWINTLFMLCDVETVANFTYEFIRLAKHKRWTVKRTHYECNDNIPEFEESRVERSETVKNRKEVIFNRLMSIDVNERLALYLECEKRVSNQCSTLDDTDILDCYSVIKYWDDMSFDQYITAQKNLLQIRNIVKTTILSNEQLLRLELNTLHKHKWGNHTLNSSLIQYKCMDRCAEVLGLENIFDDIRTFTSTDINTHSDAIRSMCHKSVSAGNRRCRRMDVNILTLLRRELRNVYGMKIQRDGRPKKGDNVTTYRIIVPDDIVTLVHSARFTYDQIGDSIPELIGIADFHAKKDMSRLLLPTDEIVGD